MWDAEKRWVVKKENRKKRALCGAQTNISRCNARISGTSSIPTEFLHSKGALSWAPGPEQKLEIYATFIIEK